MTMPDFSKIFAQNGAVTALSDNQFLQGFEYLGDNPPTKEEFNWLFQQLSLKLGYLSTTLGASTRQWQANAIHAVGDICYPIESGSYKRFECVVAGTSGAAEPTWTGTGTLVTDGTVTWIIDDVRDGVMPGRLVFDYTLRFGYLKANGALISRSAYPRIFKFANDNGLITTEALWAGSKWGLFGAGDGSTTFRLPDLRSEFLRGLDDGRGADANRILGSSQGDDFKSHNHAENTYATGSNTSYVPIGQYWSTLYGAGGASTGNTGGAETRPRNIALLACIKY